MTNRFDRLSPVSRYLSFFCITTLIVAGFSVLFFSLLLGPAGLFLGVILGIPIAVIAVCIFTPFTAIVASVPWLIGHWFGGIVQLSRSGRGMLAATLAGSAWVGFIMLVVLKLPSNQPRDSGDPIPRNSSADFLVETVAIASWFVPLVGIFVAYWIYSEDE